MCRSAAIYSGGVVETSLQAAVPGSGPVAGKVAHSAHISREAMRVHHVLGIHEVLGRGKLERY